MNKTKKTSTKTTAKILFYTIKIVLIAAMISIAVPIASNGYYGRTEKGLLVENYNIADENGNIPSDENGNFYLTVIGYQGSGLNVTIPEEIEGYKVRYIKEAAFSCNEKIMKIIVPSSVKVIEKDAFSYCINLLTVVLPQGLEEIPVNAFKGCTLLRNVVIPETVKTIGDFAFSDCSLLADLKIPKSVEFIGHDAFTACERIVLDCSENAYAKEYSVKYNVISEKDKHPNYPVYKTLSITIVLGIAVFSGDFIIRRLIRNRRNKRGVVKTEKGEVL